MIVVDTTVWIDFLGGRETPYDLHLKELIQQGEFIALTDIIFCEVLQGIRDERLFLKTRKHLLSYPILRLRHLGTFEHAAQIYRTCRLRGIIIRKTIDCLIAALCIEEGAEVFHNDKDFDRIAQVTDLRVYLSTEG